MQQFNITKNESSFHIEGFPNAVKVIRIDDPLSKRLSDLELHRDDLDFALDCLTQINHAPENPRVIRQALWRSAVIHFTKCFGDHESRFQLNDKKILKGLDPLAAVNFNFFKNLRNKHFVHDENSYSQSIPGAILNNKSESLKIAKVVCFHATAETLEQDNYNNLVLLIKTTRDWVIREFDSIADMITKKLEAESYDSLLARDSIIYTAPKLEGIDQKR